MPSFLATFRFFCEIVSEIRDLPVGRQRNIRDCKQALFRLEETASRRRMSCVALQEATRKQEALEARASTLRSEVEALVRQAEQTAHTLAAHIDATPQACAESKLLLREAFPTLFCPPDEPGVAQPVRRIPDTATSVRSTDPRREKASPRRARDFFERWLFSVQRTAVTSGGRE